MELLLSQASNGAQQMFTYHAHLDGFNFKSSKLSDVRAWAHRVIAQYNASGNLVIQKTKRGGGLVLESKTIEVA